MAKGDYKIVGYCGGCGKPIYRLSEKIEKPVPGLMCPVCVEKAKEQTESKKTTGPIRLED